MTRETLTVESGTTDEYSDKMQRDVAYLRDEYGVSVKLRKEAGEPMLFLTRDQNAFHIKDELVNMITDLGYRSSFVDYDNREIAFALKVS